MKNTGYKAREAIYNKGVEKVSPSQLLFNNLEWLTTAEAAHYLRKSKDAIRQMVCRGQIKARKFHRRLYFKRVELEQMLDISIY